MNEQQEKYDVQFYQLVISLHAAAMQQMGKVASPFTGKVDRDLQQAKHTIDLLEMMTRKMKGNLNQDEEKLLNHVLYECRMNFVEEQKKGDEPAEDRASGEEKPTDTAEKEPQESAGTADTDNKEA